MIYCGKRYEWKKIYSYAFKELWRHRTRTAASVLGYVVAVTFMVVVLSIGKSHLLTAVGVLKG